jgi:hypothetical protein
MAGPDVIRFKIVFEFEVRSAAMIEEAGIEAGMEDRRRTDEQSVRMCIFRRNDHQVARELHMCETGLPAAA